MNRDDVWRAIDDRRLSLAKVLDELTEAEWQQPSLCSGWTVRDVTAHLTLQQVGLLEAVSGFIRAPGRLNRVIQDTARRRARMPIERMIEEIRGMVGSRRHNVGVTCRETLIDILVHGADIAVPLKRKLPMPTDAAAEAATRVWTTGWPFYARRHLAGFRIEATDAAWSVGDGRLVRAPIEAILLTLTGRYVALNAVTGAGADDLRTRLSGTKVVGTPS